jgi:hypothetical protein
VAVETCAGRAGANFAEFDIGSLRRTDLFSVPAGDIRSVDVAATGAVLYVVSGPDGRGVLRRWSHGDVRPTTIDVGADVEDASW